MPETQDGPLVTMAQPVPEAVNAHPVVAGVVQNVYGDPNIQTSNAAYIAATILQNIAQFEPAALQLSRSSPQTAAIVGLSTMMLSGIISAFFPHPRA
jgi:hypothetical protein